MTRLQIVVALIGAQDTWRRNNLDDAELEKFFALAERILAMEAQRQRAQKK